MEIKGVFFDMDGVVIDSSRLWNDIITELSVKYNLDLMVVESAAMKNLSTKEAMKIVLESMGMYSDALLGDILDDAIRKGIREKTGAVYSPFAYNNSSKVYPFGVLIAGSIVEADKSAAVSEMLADISAKLPQSISPDMFDRAKTPLVKQIEKMRRDNAYWISNVLSLSQAYPERLEWARTIVSGFENISLDDVRKRASEILAKPPVVINISPEK